MPRRRKQTVWQQLWTEATPLRKITTAALTTTILVGSSVVAWSNISNSYDKWYIRHYGMAPHAAEAEVKQLQERLEVVAQYTASDLYARQVTRQMQIDELRARCSTGRSSEYDRQALNNLL